MTSKREQAAPLLALRASSKPWSEVAAAVEDARSALAVLDALLTPAQPTLDHGEVDHSHRLAEVEREIEAWSAEGIELVTLLDDYPVRLLMVHQRSRSSPSAARSHRRTNRRWRSSAAERRVRAACTSPARSPAR